MPSTDSRKKHLFEELHRLGPLSNQELADTFELSPASITQFLKPFIASGMLCVHAAQDYPADREFGLHGDKRKRRKATVYPNPDYGYFLSVQTCETELLFRKIDFTLKCFTEQAIRVPIASGDDFIAKVSEAIIQIAKSEPRKLLAAGLTVSGRRDPDTGLLSFSHDTLLPRDLDAAGKISARIGAPCIMENDANALALFERFSGIARQSEHFMCLYINEGVGIGIFANGRLYEGWRNQAGESGHWIIDPSGPALPGIPKGSFESYVSAPALQRRLSDIDIATSKESAWATLADKLGSKSAPLPEVQAVWAAIIRQTALLCVNLFHIFAPKHIFIYGPIANQELGFKAGLLNEAASLISDERATVFNHVLTPRENWQTAMALGTAKTMLDFLLATTETT